MTVVQMKDNMASVNTFDVMHVTHSSEVSDNNIVGRNDTTKDDSERFTLTPLISRYITNISDTVRNNEICSNIHRSGKVINVLKVVEKIEDTKTAGIVGDEEDIDHLAQNSESTSTYINFHLSDNEEENTSSINEPKLKQSKLS